MKKILLFSFLIAALTAFTSCNKDNDSPTLGANVKVHVRNWPGADKDGVTVYMFDKEVDSSTRKADSKKQIVTDSEGIANFDLNFTELKIIESQTSLYFAVFYTLGSQEFPAASAGITVERNRSYDVDINIPL